MLRRKWKRCHLSFLHTLIICFLSSSFCQFHKCAAINNNLSRFNSSSSSSHHYYIYEDEDDNDSVNSGADSQRNTDHYVEDFLTSFSDDTRSLPNLLNQDQDHHGRAFNSAKKKEFPVDGGGDDDINEHSLFFRSLNKSESVLVTPSSLPISGRGLDDDILRYQHPHASHILSNHHRELIGPPLPPPPIPQALVNSKNGIVPTVVVKELVHRKPSSVHSVVAVPDLMGGVVAPPLPPPPPPPPAPPLMLPGNINHAQRLSGDKKGTLKIPGFDLFDHRKGQYGIMKSRKPFRMKGLLSFAPASFMSTCPHRSGTLLILLGAIALVQIPVAGVNVPYDSGRSGDPTDPDFTYSYVLNKDVRYRKPKYFSNVSPVNSDRIDSVGSGSDSGNHKNVSSSYFTSYIVPSTTSKGESGSTALAVTSSTSSSISRNRQSAFSSPSSTSKFQLLSGIRDERLEFIHHPPASYRPLSYSSSSPHRDKLYDLSSGVGGSSGGIMNTGYNRFGFATGPTANLNSGSFSTRRGDSYFSGSSSTLEKYDKNRKGYDRGVDNESLYRPITLKGSGSGLYNSNRDRYSGSRYGSSFGSNGGDKHDMTLSQMLDMSSTTGDNLDLQHKMQIQELLYSNRSRLNEDARQLAVIPQNCWHGGRMYGCTLSVSCVLQGSKPLDLCNGGMIWACCVPREKASEASTSVGLLDNPLLSSNKTYSYDLYPPSSGFDGNHRPSSVYTSFNSNNNNQLSSSSSTASQTSPFYNSDNPIIYPYRPSFSSPDRIVVTNKPGYYNRPSFNFYRPTTYKPLLSQTSLSVSLDSESYPLYPNDVIKFGNQPQTVRPLRPFPGSNYFSSTSPPPPPPPIHPPPPPLPPQSPPLTTQHPYDPIQTNDIYHGPIGGDRDKYSDKYDNKYGSNISNGGSGNKISPSSPKGNFIN